MIFNLTKKLLRLYLCLFVQSSLVELRFIRMWIKKQIGFFWKKFYECLTHYLCSKIWLQDNLPLFISYISIMTMIIFKLYNTLFLLIENLGIMDACISFWQAHLLKVLMYIQIFVFFLTFISFVPVINLSNCLCFFRFSFFLVRTNNM